MIWEMGFGNGSGGREIPIGKNWEKPYALFNLEIDPSETTNLIDQHPDIAKRLTKEMDQIRDHQSSK